MAYLCLLQQHPDRGSLEKSGRCCKTCKYRKYLQVSDRASNPPPRDLEARTPKKMIPLTSFRRQICDLCRGFGVLKGFDLRSKRALGQKSWRVSGLGVYRFGARKVAESNDRCTVTDTPDCTRPKRFHRRTSPLSKVLPTLHTLSSFPVWAAAISLPLPASMMSTLKSMSRYSLVEM